MPEMLNALIVDDEPLARRELAMLLEGHRQVRVVGQAGSIEEASRMVRQHDPEVVFLDVRLARGTGFDLLESLPEETSVVFVTAHADQAVEAFAVDAADYLLKPVRPRRLAETIGRLEREHAEPPADGATRLIPDDRLLVRASGRTVIVPVRHYLLRRRGRSEPPLDHGRRELDDVPIASRVGAPTPVVGARAGNDATSARRATAGRPVIGRRGGTRSWRRSTTGHRSSPAAFDR